jgi:hypothetical protein
MISPFMLGHARVYCNIFKHDIILLDMVYYDNM